METPDRALGMLMVLYYALLWIQALFFLHPQPRPKNPLNAPIEDVATFTAVKPSRICLTFHSVVLVCGWSYRLTERFRTLQQNCISDLTWMIARKIESIFVTSIDLKAGVTFAFFSLLFTGIFQWLVFIQPYVICKSIVLY